jgi:hypothetical protein
MKISYDAKTFRLIAPKLCNADWFDAMGWFKSERGYENHHEFSTRSLFAVSQAVELGYKLHKSAADAIKAHKDDPCWVFKMNARREAARKRREHQWQAKQRARKALIDSARAKLTPQEWAALRESCSMGEGA